MSFQTAVVIQSKNPVHQYLREMLANSGIPFHLCDSASGPQSLFGFPIWIVLIHARSGLDADWIAAIETHHRSGGSVVLLGPPVGFEELLGIDFDGGYHLNRPEWLGVHHSLGEGYAEPAFDPITHGAPRPLHTFGGSAFRARPGSTLLARFRDHSGAPTDFAAGVARPRDNDSGPFVAWGVDLVASVHRIRHGIPVDRDGVPAPDGTAPLDDDILKSEDGLVLDWVRDRGFDQAAGFAYFDVPVADHLCRWLAQSVVWCAQQTGVPLRVLRPTPKGVQRIAHLSLDTDSNDPDLARKMIRRLAENDIHATWCHILPGYDPSEHLFESLRESGHENAFHYDSGWSPGGPWHWSEREFLNQLAQVQQLAGTEKLTTNKNHYTRWEGCTECYDWCAQSGIGMDGTRGPSKPGTLGFPFGSAVPWFPISRDGAFIDCLEFPFTTQDLVVTVPSVVRKRILESAFAANGHAHFLFHPQHIATSGVAEALAALAADAREYGAEWWTAREISTWERRRRRILANPETEDDEADWWTVGE